MARIVRSVVVTPRRMISWTSGAARILPAPLDCSATVDSRERRDQFRMTAPLIVLIDEIVSTNWTWTR